MRTDIRYIGLDCINDEKQREIIKRIIRKNFNQGEAIETLPLTEATRFGDFDCEYWTEYGLFDGAGMGDGEVQEVIDEMRYRVYSPYDCTGKPYTVWISWHRNPSGLISYIHRVGLDV